MRSIYGISAAMAALSISAGLHEEIAASKFLMPVASTGPSHKANGITRMALNNKYERPHSSKRQIDRNTRQLAAGQISFIKHGPTAA